jgi:hypothetical protein
MLGGKHGVCALAAVASVLSTTAAAVEGKAEAAPPNRVTAANIGPALGFVENRGQTNARVRYYVQGDRYAFYVTRDELLLSFLGRHDARGVTLALRFLGRNPASAPVGVQREAGEVNYVRGSDPTRWRTKLRHFHQIVYHDLWPHIDLRLRQQGGALKYEFRVRPGAQPSDIRLAYVGPRRLARDESGNLMIRTGLGTLRDSRPISRQGVAHIATRFVVSGHRFGFAVGRYRHDRDLVIDPGIQYTTFLGGSSHETGAGIAVDGSGNAFVVGTTQSPDFPTTVGAFRRTGSAGNNPDVFVSKLNAAGTALVYSTFVGGSGFDFARGIAIDAGGNAYITGQTTSSNFPTTAGAFSRTLHIPPNCPRCASADNYDGFVAKLNASGSGLAYSTYLGGTDIDSPRGIAIDGAGNAYVTGETVSVDFPTTAGAFSRTERGAYDMFVTKVSTTGSALAYSTYLGGTQVDDGQRVAVDSGGNAYALGFTSSVDFPTTAGAFDTTANGGFDVTVTKLNPAGSAVVYSTYLGGQGSDSGGGLVVDGSGNAYVAGGSGSTDFPTTPGAFDTASDGNDAFLAKLNAAGAALAYSTVLGGTASDGDAGVAVDASGNAWLTGTTSSVDFPVSADAADPSFNGTADAFISEVNAAGSALPYSTYLGGSQSDSGIDVALDTGGNPYVTGQTFSLDFPATTGALDTVFNGDPSIFWGDAFVTKLALARTTSTPPAPPPVPAAPTLLAPANADTPAQPITFDWSDAAGAASYTIQIDDSNTFTAPLEREATLTSSMYATTDLSTATHFWRVRGVNSAGTAGPWSAVRSFTPQAPPPAATLSTMNINPSTVVGGDASFGTVVLSTPAPASGAVVSLSSSNPAVATVPATTTVPSTGFTGDFTVTTSPVSASVSIVITASYNGSTRTATLTVTPPAPPAPAAALQSVSVSPASVTGGSGAQGTVTLTGAAPQAGATVSLASSNAAASVPASVTVPSGASTATFAVSTAAVTTSTAVTISAAYNGGTATATLTVSPAPPPPQTATLTVTATGRSGERVTSSPAGISVATGSSGSASFATGTAVTLTVSNGRDAIWSGACSSNGAKTKTCTLTLGGPASVTANVQ